jgi:peptidoglycan-associated lipoprotein
MYSHSTCAKFVCLSAVLVLAACATKEPPPPPAPPAPPPEAAAPPPPTSTIIPGSLQDFEQNVGDRVFFDFDRSDLDQTDRDTLQRQADWLQMYPNVVLTIEGHCDERGTREYNLALGARRAAAVKEFLTSLGVNPARLETISYGKERPVCAESAEDCWQRNRRGVSVIKSGAVGAGA